MEIIKISLWATIRSCDIKETKLAVRETSKNFITISGMKRWYKKVDIGIIFGDFGLHYASASAICLNKEEDIKAVILKMKALALEGVRKNIAHLQEVQEAIKGTDNIPSSCQLSKEALEATINCAEK